MPLRRLPPISSAEPSTPPALRVASLEEVQNKTTWLDSQEARDAEPIHWESYECQLVTPLFGGGVVAGQVDQRMPIRASAIRGQLRFWWRLLASKRLKDNAEQMSEQEFARKMREEEFSLWGGLGTPPQASRVWVEVKHDKPLKLTEAGNINSYALGGGKVDEVKINDCPTPWVLRMGCCLSLSDTQKQEVTDAVRWWANFGGVGARTRRGFGAVSVPGLPVVTDEEIKAAGCQFILNRTQKHDAHQAWNLGIKALRDFRQGKPGRNRGETRYPGRSHWPEADAIRRLTGRHHNYHAPEHTAGNVFPRAAFGMPIIFHFKDRQDPSDFSLQPVKYVQTPGQSIMSPVVCERLASPLILRPIKQGNTWRAAALLLPYEKILDLAVTQPDGTVTNSGEWWDAAQAVNIPPMHAQNQNNPLLAFLQYFKTYPSQTNS